MRVALQERPRVRAAVVAALICCLLAGSASILEVGRAASAAESPGSGLTDSAMTVTVTDGPFEGLEVTVSQTRDLVNQAVDVSWAGGEPSVRSGQYRGNYLQIMQCWGDPEEGPERDQCQFGATAGASQGGNWTSGRQLTYGNLLDPLETRDGTGALVDGVDGVTYGTPGGQAYTQFSSVTGTVVTHIFQNPFFDWQKTNEIPYGRTRANGEGEEIFEVQTELEAPGLGCGAGTPDGPRRCWLVVVPRGMTEVDGSSAALRVRGLDSSPLSMGNWQHRIMFPLDFQPPATVCPLGSEERRMAGSELVTEAILSWQPSLCTETGVTYGFSQLSDENARRQLLDGSLGMVLASRPVQPASVPADKSLVYAPVALSGAAIAFNIERQLPLTSTDPRQGDRVHDLNLTPRLVAKLLTQSYQTGSDRRLPHMEGAPYSLRDDPEFLEANPDWDDWTNVPLGGVVVSLERSDAAWELWRWVSADPEARAFLEGQPDPWGMTINPFYLESFGLPRDDFPKNDQACWPTAPPPPGERAQLCIIDAQPYAGSMHVAAVTTRRGDTLARSSWDPNAVPPSYRPVGPQIPGKRLVLTITDLASAARFGLQTASLRNAAGEFVAPSDTSLLASAAGMQESEVPGVLQPAPGAQTPGAYPLGMLVYAATVNQALDDAARSDYITFLRYAAGEGQDPGVQPGQLPPGYVPLPPDLRDQVLAAAALLEQGPPPPPPGTPDGTGSGSWGIPAFSTFGDFAGSSFSSGSLSSGASLGGLLGSDALLAASGSPSGTSTVGSTPGEPLGLVRFLVVGVLALGIVAAVAGPLVRRLGRPAS